MVGSHSVLPLHRIEVRPEFVFRMLLTYIQQKWTGTFFLQSSLRELGAVIHLGHRGSPCPRANSDFRRNGFIICSVDCIHRVDIVFCQCRHPTAGFVPHYTQLLRMGWYSTSHTCIKSAFTFALLDFFVDLNHQAKVNTYDYYKTLERQTDICRLGDIPVSSR